MELIHYSSPYKIIANKAEEQIQRVAEMSGIVIEIAESETNGVRPEDYFATAFVEVISELYNEFSGESQKEEEIRGTLSEIVQYINGALTEARIFIEKVYSEYVELIEEIDLSGDEIFSRKLEFYADITFESFYYKASCYDVVKSLNEYIQSNIEYDDTKIKTVKNKIEENLL